MTKLNGKKGATITAADVQQALNAYLGTPGLLFLAGQGAIEFAERLAADLGLNGTTG